MCLTRKYLRIYFFWIISQDLSYMFDMNMYTYLGMCLTMTYLRKYAYTSLGMSFLMGAFAQVVYAHT
jgi:hypothetical protein